MKFSKDIYRLQFIKRYSNIPTIHDESVAEHSFFVAALLFELNDEYLFNLGLAVAMAIAHDMPEMELNDCPHIIKAKYPKIAEAFNEYEQVVAKQLPIAALNAVTMYKEAVSTEAKVVRLADVLQCMQYATKEVDNGNKGYMLEVLQNSRQRAEQLREELKYAKRN